ncbi:hypothetical protein JaAD80_13980 [Janthinobacterium sp. AD80]|nr:hypothetical protein JaAD80_13980 [Janthinobacterium sp. AD80]
MRRVSGGSAMATAGSSDRRTSRDARKPSGLCASRAAVSPCDTNVARASSQASRAGLRRLRAGPNGSSTMPPPTVCVACALRTTKRSPGTPCMGASNTSCTLPVWPGDSVSPSSMTARASWCAAPRCTCSGDQAFRCTPASGSRVRVTSRRSEHCASAGATIQLPRSMRSRAMPARFSARRWPAMPVSAARFCAWMLRTRACASPGTSCRVSPVAAMPASAVPVTTVPCPDKVNTRSTPRRNKRRSSRCGRLRDTCVRWASRAATPGSLSTLAAVGKMGLPASGVPCSSTSISASTCATRALSTRSIFVSATAPRVTPSSCKIARCSCVCGMMPSSAATTSSAKSMPVTPDAMVRMNFSWPGTSITPSTVPSGSGR